MPINYVYLKAGYYTSKTELAAEAGVTTRGLRQAIEQGRVKEIILPQRNIRNPVRIIPMTEAEAYLEKHRRRKQRRRQE